MIFYLFIYLQKKAIVIFHDCLSQSNKKKRRIPFSVKIHDDTRLNGFIFESIDVKNRNNFIDES